MHRDKKPIVNIQTIVPRSFQYKVSFAGKMYNITRSSLPKKNDVYFVSLVIHYSSIMSIILALRPPYFVSMRSTLTGDALDPYVNRPSAAMSLALDITMTSYWVRWRLKSPALPLFTQPLIQLQMKGNIKVPCHWSL